MKSIDDTLKLANRIAVSLSGKDAVYIALVGGYAAIAHGVERTTADVDFCIYTGIMHLQDAHAFIKLLKKVIPEYFQIKFMEGGKIIDDPFKHDIIFLHDKSGKYPKIDFIVAKYKWELEGLQHSKPLEDIPFPVMPKPYLIAMKLKAGSPKDDFDIIELYSLLTDKEKAKTHELAKLTKRDKKLRRLLKPRKEQREREDKDQLL